MERSVKKLPVKQTANLIPPKDTAKKTFKFLLGLLIAVLVIGLFCKFAVVDRLEAAHRAEMEATAAEQRLKTLQEENTAYDMVRAEYTRYFSSSSLGSGVSASCMEVLDLVESALHPEAGISSFQYGNDVLTLRLTGTDLDRASRIISSLYDSPLVSRVELSSVNDAGSGESADSASVMMTIMFLSDEGGAR